MGRLDRRYNQKGRISSGNNRPSKLNETNVQVEFSNEEKEKYDESNPLVLSGSRKKKAKKEFNLPKLKKPLTKKKRKELEKVLERKKKKEKRAEVLEKLALVQAKPEDLKHLCSTSTVQTYGIKRFAELPLPTEPKQKAAKISNLRGSNTAKNKNIAPVELSSTDISSDDEDEAIKIDDNNDTNVNDDNTNASEPTQLDQEPKSTDSVSSTSKDSTGNKEIQKKDESTPKPVEKIPAAYVTVDRKPEIQKAREALPIFGEEQAIIEAIKENPVVIIHGETGSGKTTQVPQFLFEAGFTKNEKTIGITEPRRIAAMTMAARVGDELNMPEKVSYHIRYNKTITKSTEIKFMTDGVLLKEIRHDFFLTRYSVIIIDEAHERSVFSDVLIGLLSRIIRVREKRKDPLKLIIMSATMRVQEFTENRHLFKEEPFLIRISSRQYKVQVHFDLQTPTDYVEAAYNKVCKIHRRLPPGSILVFLTGEKEVQRLCKMLRETFKDGVKEDREEVQTDSCVEKPTDAASPEKKKNKEGIDTFCSLPSNFNLDNFSIEPLDTEDLQHQQSDDEDATPLKNGWAAKEFENATPLYTLPLYSILPFEEQEKVFKPPPTGSRLCVVATNVAETSITIPRLKYVVDTGKVKTKVYDTRNGGISKFQILWCSKASANQRAGRSGRTEGGHCYRLYSSAVFQHEFPDFSLPEIQTIPVDDVLLQMKALGIDRVVAFPFPSPPEQEALMAAEKRLVVLGALQDIQNKYRDLEQWEYSAPVTPLGKAMSRFPLSPRYAKMLLLSYKHNCIPHIVAIVCALTVPDIFITTTITEEGEDGEETTKVVTEGIKRIGVGEGNSVRLGDIMVLLRAVALFEESRNGVKFCLRNGIRFKAMAEIHKMMLQLLREINRAFPDAGVPHYVKITPPTEEQIETIRKIVAACVIDRVARKMPRDETKDDKSLKNAYQCVDLESPAFIHPSSTMFERLPQYIVYTEMVETSKLYMKGVVEIECEWLPIFSPHLLSSSETLTDSQPNYNRETDKIYSSRGGNFGPWKWDLPVIRMEMSPGRERYCWFCFFLLDGQVLPFFKSYKEFYRSNASVILKSWATKLKQSKELLQAVIAKDVDSREALLKMWKKDPRYLLPEFLEWLPNEKHCEVELKWPPK